MVDFLLEALKSFVFDLRQRVVFKDRNEWLVISHELELDTSDEGCGLLGSPNDGEKFQFNHGVARLGWGKKARASLDDFPLTIDMLLEDEPQTIEA